MRFPNQLSRFGAEIARPDLCWISRFRSPDESFAIRRKSRARLVIRRRIQPPRFAAAGWDNPQMRNLRVLREIDIFAIEYNPSSIRRRHRRTDALESHHVFKGEWMLWRRRGRWSESRKRQRERPRYNLPMHGVYVVLKRATNPGGSASPTSMGNIAPTAPDLT